MKRPNRDNYHDILDYIYELFKYADFLREETINIIEEMAAFIDCPIVETKPDLTIKE